MMRGLALSLLFAAAAFAADANSKERDLCFQPPGAIAPALPAKLMTGQGNIHFPITTSNPEAQKFFDQGVNQLHSFWAVEAERSFLQAAALDPAAPMPWWGVAMVAAGDYRPRHQLERDASPKTATRAGNLKGGAARALAAAQKAVALSAVPGKATDLEKLYIASIDARREQPNSDDAYIAGLRQIMAKYPDEVEAGSYLALHLMRGFTLPDRKPREGTMESVELLRQLVAKFPDHPGVHHYIIHGWEGASFAKEAWPSCRRYPELVPNIPHALHMPGHIWAQTGKWDEAVKSFEDSAENERSYMKADALYGSGHYGHNLQFLITTYGFQGRADKALETAKLLLAIPENPREKAVVDDTYVAYRQGWFGTMRTLVTFQMWDAILDGKTLPIFDKPREQAWRHWAVALALAHKGAADLARREEHSMEESLKQFSEKTGHVVPPVLEVARKELQGQIALADKKIDKGLKLLETAGQMERALRYTEPPSYPRPVLDVLGAEAFAAARMDIAESAWRGALEQTPGDPRAAEGLARISSGRGKAASGGF